MKRMRTNLFVLLCLAASLGCASTAELEVPKRGGVLRTAYSSDFRSLDPAMVYDSRGISFMRLIFRGVFEYDVDGALLPDQIRDWSLSSDRRTYTFRLQPGIRFAHGREVEAEDYIFSLERILDPANGSMGTQFFSGIRGAREFTRARKAMLAVPDGAKQPGQEFQPARVAGLRAPAKDTLVIELNQPDPVFRLVLGMGFARVVPRDLVQQPGVEFACHLVGTGPYYLKEWKRGMRCRFERNPYYSGPDGYVDAIELTIGGDPALHDMMFERGELDMVLRPSPVDIPRLRRDPSRRGNFVAVALPVTDWLFMNTEMKPFDDVRVRRAVSHAVNKNRLLGLVNHLPIRAQGVLPPLIPGWDAELRDFYPYDPAKARSLLREAGYFSGFQTQLWFPQDLMDWARMAAGIQHDLLEVGIRAELNPVTYASFIAASQTRKRVPFGVSGWLADYPDPSTFFDAVFDGSRITPTDCSNMAFYDNAEVNRLLAEARMGPESNARLELFRRVERIILADAPVVPLTHSPHPILIQSWLHGFKGHSVWICKFETLWFKN